MCRRGLDFFLLPVYNKSTRRCPLQTGTSPWWKPDGCHTTYDLQHREINPQHMSRLLATDGSLLFIVQIQHERHNAGNGAQGSKDRQNHLRNMYRLPRKVFPRELSTSLHSAQHGMAGNRLLPHTVYKGGKNSTWTVGFHLKSIIQDSVDLSNKLGAKDRAAICGCPAFLFSSDSAFWWSGST